MKRAFVICVVTKSERLAVIYLNQMTTVENNKSDFF